MVIDFEDLDHQFDYRKRNPRRTMKLKVIVHRAEEGGYWAEVPAIPGCVSQGDSLDELRSNILEAIDGCLSVEVGDFEISETDRIIEVAV